MPATIRKDHRLHPSGFYSLNPHAVKAPGLCMKLTVLRAVYRRNHALFTQGLTMQE
jgi:hypothetical protein